MKKQEFLEALSCMDACSEAVGSFERSRQSPKVWLNRVRKVALRELAEIMKSGGPDYVFYAEGFDRYIKAGWVRYCISFVVHNDAFAQGSNPDFSKPKTLLKTLQTTWTNPERNIHAFLKRVSY